MNSSAPAVLLSVSVVLYDTDISVLEKTLMHLVKAAEKLKSFPESERLSLCLLDNHPQQTSLANLPERCMEQLSACFDQVNIIKNTTNLGYGGGHNRCIENRQSRFHLILNPDVFLEEDALLKGVAYLQANIDVGLLAPHVVDEKNRPLYLCKRFPTVLDFLLRGFAPSWVKRFFGKRLANYEMQDVYTAGRACKEIPIISGCCMLARTQMLKSVGGFSKDYFLYFEDFDLSLRMAWLAKVAYCPDMKIIHVGGHSAKKGWHHIRLFARSAITFYNTYGWRWL
ncbi:MAG: glycosyltransferase [Pseudomonadales bacterium]|nr:glycosyltransferase [Pseudomonadales bacterium]